MALRKDNPKWKATAKKAQRRHRLKSLFGLTEDQYNRQLEAQDNKCAICRTSDPGKSGRYAGPCRFAVDHNHDTGQIRALLCGQCNKGLGHFKDNPDLLREAYRYLEQYLALDSF